MRGVRSRWAVLAGATLALVWLVPVGGSALGAVQSIEPSGAASAQSVSSSSTADVRAYVTQVYRDLFERDPDPEGLATWTGKLLSGVPYSSVANAITSSTEYRSRLISAAYLQYLGRAPEPAGLQFWLGQMTAGRHIEQMQAGFIASDEFYARGGGTARGWVTLLYGTALGRSPGASEVDWWVSAMADGMNRGTVAAGFLYSTEHLTGVVDGYYLDLLGRHIDPSGRATWVGLIQTGHRDEEIIAGIVSSAEYRSKVRPQATAVLVPGGPRVSMTGSKTSKASISGDGRWVAFETTAPNVAGVTTAGTFNVFVWDRTAGSTTLVSAGVDGSSANGDSWGPSISTDGRWIAFQSGASNLVHGDVDGANDVFVWDGLTGVTSLVTVRMDGSPSNGHSFSPSVSADGRWIAYQSTATNLADGNAYGNGVIYLTDRTTGATTLVSAAADGGSADESSQNPSISADGRWVAYESKASNLATGDMDDKWDVFLWSRETGKTTFVSATGTGSTFDNFGASALSDDGRSLTYTAGIWDDVFGHHDVFSWDRVTGATSLVSAGLDHEPLIASSFGSTISADGRWIAFTSGQQGPGYEEWSQVFVTDRVAGRTSVVSVGLGGAQANYFSQSASISADGRWIAFASVASNLVEGDTDGAEDWFVARNPLAP